MSYYDDCKYEFTDGQNARMHDYLVLPEAVHLVTTSCPNDLPTCNDIIIAGTVTWANQTVELCPNQRIFISVNSRLILDNCILTKKVTTPTVGCLDLDFWDGIYFEPGYCDPPGPMPCPHLGGALTTLNGTIIEYSKNGVVAEDKFLFIDMTNTIMRKNGKAFTAVNSFNPGANPLGTGDIGRIDLLNTTILVDDRMNTTVPIKDVQINLVGRPLTMYNCTLKVVNPSVQQGSAIVTVGGGLTILGESRIENFEQAIYKDIDNPYAWDGGLWIEDSKILNCETAIINKCNLVHVEHNFIRGHVISEGLCYGRWYRNNIGGSDPLNENGKFHFTNPQLSIMIENNLFEQANVWFYNNNKESQATCNTWNFTTLDFFTSKYDGTSVAQIGSTMPAAWGSDDVASGNSHTLKQADDVEVRVTLAKNGSGLAIKNYEDDCMCPRFNFLYDGTFTVGNAEDSHPECPSDWPTSATGGGSDGSSGNGSSDSSLDSLWLLYDGMILLAETDLLTADSAAKILLNEDIDLYKAQRDNIVGQVLFTLNQNNTPTWINLWKTRASSKLGHNQQIMDLLTDSQLHSLTTLLGGLTTATAEDASDLIVFSSSISLMQDWHNTSLDVYHLPIAQLDTLTDLAESSFGDYTSILRAFLNAYYGIQISSDVGSINNGSKRKAIQKTEVAKDNMLIVPNPNSGCFKLKGEGAGEKLAIEIIDLSGRIMMKKTTYSDEEICTNELLIPSIYLVKYRNTITGNRGTVKLIIK